MWVNPPFSMISVIVQHFLMCKQRCPIGTAMLLLVPVWTDEAWYRLIREMPLTFKRVRRWPAGSNLFTAPSHPNERTQRKLVGDTRFAVEVYFVSAAELDETVPGWFVAEGEPRGGWVLLQIA